MCTLRNFPHLTDHCIEWARDQFELLFTKLGKSLESYLKSPAEYEHKILDKAGSEPGAAFFDVRSLTSFAKLAANPSIGKAAQVAFDIFHFLFRDKILDLQNAFPKDYRIIDEKTKQDKGPFWGEKKRYPTVAVFNPNDDSHLDFLLSTTCLLSVCVGLISPKQEGDDSWLKEYRSRDWIMNISSGLSLPPYIPAPVNSEGMENAPTMDKAALQSILTTLLDDLKSSSGSLDFNRTFEPADFEKDDDLNFHISFVTSSTNLRCDNYSIKRTDFHGCKVIAGRIIPAIATTTAAVCGLVMLELFKVVLKKDTEAYMNRAIGLGGNSYTSFTAEKPNSFKTSTTVEVPENLPQEAYNEKGVVKEEFCDKVVKRAYPEGHSVWDKLVCNADMTLAEFCKWLLEEHGLKIQSWNFIYGYRNVVDEHTKQKQLSPVTSPVYPPKPILDYALIPSLDLTLAQATTALMKSPAARQMQQYLALWREFKVAGTIPAQPPITEATITDKSTIRQILVQMTKISEEALANGLIETTTISNIASRKFVLLSSSETPSCIHAETGDDVEHLCAFKIMLE